MLWMGRGGGGVDKGGSVSCGYWKWRKGEEGGGGGKGGVEGRVDKRERRVIGKA